MFDNTIIKQIEDDAHLHQDINLFVMLFMTPLEIAEQELKIGLRIDLRFSYKEVFIHCGEGDSFQSYIDEEMPFIIEIDRVNDVFKVNFSVTDFPLMGEFYCGDRVFGGEYSSYEEWFYDRGKAEEESWLCDQLEEALRLRRGGTSPGLLRLGTHN